MVIGGIDGLSENELGGKKRRVEWEKISYFYLMPGLREKDMFNTALLLSSETTAKKTLIIK
jgi:hypothetical protein